MLDVFETTYKEENKMPYIHYVEHHCGETFFQPTSGSLSGNGLKSYAGPTGQVLYTQICETLWRNHLSTNISYH